MSKIVKISNGVAEVEWRKNSEYALAEIDERYDKVGDEVPEFRLVYNGGGRQYDDLYARFIGDDK